MTSKEFKRRLNALSEVLNRGLAYYAVWQKLVLHDPKDALGSLDQLNAVLGRFRGFFTPIGHALLDGAYLQFAKVFDEDSRTVSIRVLLRAARKDMTLVPRAKPQEMKNFADELKQNATLLKELKKRRNQYIAHVDANPAPLSPQLKTEFDNFVERVKSAFNTLSVAHDGNVYSWDYMLKRAERDTVEVMRVLLEEMERRQKQYDEEMARIVLDEIRKWETTMGRQPEASEMQSIIQRYGVTDEQKRRVEEEYKLSLRS